MAEIKFEHLLELIQSKESIPDEMLSSQDGLIFRDIHFTPLRCSLRMQQIPLHYLKCLVEHKAFKPEGISKNLYSHSMAILFLSDDMLEVIKHVHIGLVVCHISSELFNQDGILPFIESIQNDLKEVRELHTQGKEVSRIWSYTYLVANYRGIMALPADPSYCLVYPMVCDNEVQNKTHFNTKASPSGMHTEACLCHSLLHLMDADPANRQKFKGSCIIILCGVQHKTMFSIIAKPHNHHEPLIDPNTVETYPMEVVGNFCLEDTFFPDCLEDSLMFHVNELTELAEQGIYIPTYKTKAAESTGSSKTHQSPHPKEHLQKPPHKDKESSKPSSKTSGTSLPRVLNSTSTSKPSCRPKVSPPSKEQKDKCDQEKHSPQPKEQKDKRDHEDCNISNKPKESSCSEKDHKWSSDKDSSSSASHVSHKCHPSLHSSFLECSSKKTCMLNMLHE